MRRLVLVLALSSLGACGAGSTGASNDSTAATAAGPALPSVATRSVAATTTGPATFADAVGPPTSDGGAQTLTLSDGRKLSITSVQFTPAPGKSEMANTEWCGVEVEGQAVTVIGVGPTETVSCEGLSAAGPVSGGRIGLIYKTSSPNAESLTSVVISKASGKWAVDEAATEGLQDQSPKTLEALRKALH